MYFYFRSEALKIKHTFIEKLIFLAPFSCLFLAFMFPKYFQIDAYNWWYVTVLPGMLTLMCVLVAQKDKKMKERAVLPLPINLKKVWISKVLLCAVILLGACIILFLGSAIISGIFNFNPVGRITFLNALIANIVLVLAYAWQIPLCLYLGYKIGMFPTIIINFIANIFFSVIFSLVNIWWIIPYAIPCRLMIPIIKMLPNGLPAVKGSMTFSPELLSAHVILPGISITVVLFIVFTIVTTKWYEGREAK